MSSSRAGRPQRDRDARPHYVYCHYDAADQNRLLYVGMTMNARIRPRSRKGRSWMAKGRDISVFVSEPMTRDAAVQLERSLIKWGAPLHNTYVPTSTQEELEGELVSYVAETNGWTRSLARWSLRYSTAEQRAAWKSGLEARRTSPAA